MKKYPRLLNQIITEHLSLTVMEEEHALMYDVKMISVEQREDGTCWAQVIYWGDVQNDDVFNMRYVKSYNEIDK